MGNDKVALSQKIIDIVVEIFEILEYRSPTKKQYTNLVKRLKLLNPMFEEILDSKDSLLHECIKALAWLLMRTLKSAKDVVNQK